MAWAYTLLSWFAQLSTNAYQWSIDVAGWVWPLSNLRYVLVGFSNLVFNIYLSFVDFYYWVMDIETRLTTIFSWQTIINYLQSAVASMGELLAWFNNWYNSVQVIVQNYFNSMAPLIQDWISTATAGLSGMLAAWDNFRINTLPDLFDIAYAELWWASKIVDVGQLITSSFAERSDLWSGWAELRQRVSDFISAPFDWIADHFVSWFLGD